MTSVGLPLARHSSNSHGSHLHEISEFVYAIPGKFLVDVEDFYEICNEVVHEQ